jgi:hypothetical protein
MACYRPSEAFYAGAFDALRLNTSYGPGTNVISKGGDFAFQMQNRQLY